MCELVKEWVWVIFKFGEKNCEMGVLVLIMV